MNKKAGNRLQTQSSVPVPDALDWELRPGGMLVQRRDSSSFQSPSSGPLLKLKVSYGQRQHDITIPSEATFGELKWVLAPLTGLHPQEQRLLFRGKEREDADFLHMAGVCDLSKLSLVEDPASKEKKREELRQNENMAKACQAVALIRDEVDKLSGQISSLESDVSNGKKIDEHRFSTLSELLMRELLRLDGIEAQGEAKVQRKIEVSSPKWLYKKVIWIWKVIILVALGLSGMYICISGIEKRILHSRIHKRELFFTSDNKEVTRDNCPNLSVTDKASSHYPKPRTFDRMDCSCTPVHNFVIFSMQRSGSGWFETLINSHPSISSHGEVFSVNRRKTSLSMIKRTLDTIYNLDWRSSASKNDCTVAVGLKWMFNQGIMEYDRGIAAYLKANSVSIIFLIRRNILRRYVSILANSFDRAAKQLNGTHLAHVHSKEEAKILAAYRPTVDLTSLIPYLKRVHEIMETAHSSFKEIRHITIYYEDLVANQRKEMLKAQKFLGVKPIELESKHVKIHTRPLHEQIENWYDLYEALKGTRYEILLRGKDYG